MKRIAYLLLGIASFATVMTACKDPNEGSTFSIYDEDPIGLALENHKDYSMWVEMLKKVDLFNALNLGAEKAQYTVFAVKNDAVEAFLTEKGYASIDDIDEEYLTTLMRYHVICNTPIPLNAILTGRLSDTTASGDYLMAQYIDGNNVYINEEAKIINDVNDLSLSNVLNGYVHTLDKVLNPVVTSVWEQIQAEPKYSIFTAAVELTGFDELLDEEYYYVKDTVMNTSSRYRRRTTLFMVDNDTFAEAGINSLQDLIDRYAYGYDNYTDPSNQLYKFVGYHMINGYNAFDDLTNFPTAIKLRNVSSYASSELIQLEEEKGILYLNRADNGGTTLADNFDIPARNGVIHELAGLMPLFVPAATTVLIELTDYLIWPEWATIPIYRGSSRGTYTIDPTTFSFIRWSTPDGNASGKLVYDRRPGWSYFANADILQADMGGIGWWEIDLPAIVRGRYQFQVRYHYATGNRGTYQTLFNGKAMGSPINFRNPASGGYSDSWSPNSTIYLAESGVYTLRFQQVTTGIMEIDQVRFTPLQD